MTSAPTTQSAKPLVRLSIDPEWAEQNLTRLMPTFAESLRRLPEAQAVGWLGAETILAEEAKRFALVLPRSREAMASLCNRLGPTPNTLNLDRGPVGQLL